jgi:ribose/xylose/arabinose/galactoside ABC-type transport system permease subunit
LSGGVGSLVGTFFGALVMTILGNILNLLKVGAFYQYIAKGLILAIAAVSLSRGVRFAK